MRQSKDALSSLERNLLGGKAVHFDGASLGHSLRYRGLIALADGRDLEAVNLFRRSKDAFEPESLERADPILEREGYANFTLEQTA